MRNLLFCLVLIFAASCNSEDNETETPPETGILEVIILSTSDEPIAEAVVSIEPTLEEKTTGNSGIVTFTNLDPGVYTINVIVPSDFVHYTSSANVIAGQTASISMEVGPEPITESPLMIDLLLETCYNRLKGENLFDAAGYSSYWGDTGADILYKNSGGNSNSLELDLYNFSSTNGIIGNVWGDHYVAIRQVNLGLDALESNDFTSEQPIDEGEVKGEFLFLRAVLYFNLVKLFGNPIVNTTAVIDFDNPAPVVQGREETYDLIVSDLTEAQNLLKVTSSNIRASLAASQALLGKVYLQMAGYPLQQADKYALALAEFEKLKGSFPLEVNYSDIFSLLNEDSTTEVIFKIPFDEDGDYGSFWGPVGIAPQDQYEMAAGFSENFFEVPGDVVSPVTFPLDVDDFRFEQNVAAFKYENQIAVNEVDLEDWRPYKFKKDLDEVINFRAESFDFPYMRYADVLLMIAEAENAINGPTAKAYGAINEVRRRAYGNTDHNITPGLDQQDFLLEVLAERRRELCFEGHRRDDLIRTQTLEGIISDFNNEHPQLFKNYESYKQIWPIPQEEINLNPQAEQNPGY